LQDVGEDGVAERAITFADEKFGRVPAIVAADVGLDKIGEGTRVLVNAPEILVLGFADGVAEAGADGIDEDEVGFVEQAVGIVFELVGSGRSDAGVDSGDALGSL